jgi:acetolactate synthase I/II/III large subunit
MGSRQLAEAATAGLRRAGVRRLFGLPGGGPNLDLIGAAHDLPFTLAHGETAACVMAGAFGLLTGTPGVAVVTRGPGVTSAANGLAQATLDRAPLLLVSDCVTADQRRRVAHQRLDQRAFTAPVTRFSGVVGHTDAAATVAAAAALALGPPAGAVHLDYDPSLPGDRPPRPPRAQPSDPGALAAACATARGCRRPVVVLGLGAVAHAAELRAVLAGIPVLTTYQATGTVSATAAEWAGPFTNAALERPLLEQADLVIGVGLDDVEPIPAAWSTAAPTVLLDAAPSAYFDGAVAVPGPRWPPCARCSRSARLPGRPTRDDGTSTRCAPASPTARQAGCTPSTWCGPCTPRQATRCSPSTRARTCSPPSRSGRSPARAAC